MAATIGRGVRAYIDQPRQVEAMLDRVGVELVFARDGNRGLAPGQTRAWSTIYDMANRYGVRSLETALAALLAAAGDRRDQLKRTLIAGAVIAAYRYKPARAELAAVLATMDCDAWLILARERSERERSAVKEALARELGERLRDG